jgi:hypothetical protein
VLSPNKPLEAAAPAAAAATKARGRFRDPATPVFRQQIEVRAMLWGGIPGHLAEAGAPVAVKAGHPTLAALGDWTCGATGLLTRAVCNASIRVCGSGTGAERTLEHGNIGLDAGQPRAIANACGLRGRWWRVDNQCKLLRAASPLRSTAACRLPRERETL